MASRKDLKKGINYIIGELFTECVFISLSLPEADKAKADKVMTDILNMQDDFVSRISHTEPGNVKGLRLLQEVARGLQQARGRNPGGDGPIEKLIING